MKLPDFIIAGIHKSGTTSLWVNLSKHPRIEMSPNAFRYVRLGMMKNNKECHFFNARWSNGVRWYQRLFNSNDKLQGEASPNYLFREEYIKRMSSIVPHAKIIVALRNPVTRAYSHYNHLRQSFLKSLPIIHTYLGHKEDLYIRWAKLKNFSFDEAVKKETDKGISPGCNIIERGLYINPIRDLFHQGLTAEYGIIGRGLYINLIEDLLKYYSRKQVLIIISEQMKQDMQGTYDKIFNFLNVERAVINFDMDVHVRKYEKLMSPWAQETLNKIYSSYNERLFNFLGYKVPEWDMASNHLY